MKVIGYIRPDDWEVFTINNDGSFSNQRMKEEFPKHMHQAWSGETLQSHGFYKIVEN